MSHIYFGVDA